MLSLIKCRDRCRRWANFEGVEQKAHFFALDLSHSDACYIRAYPEATSEAWVDGHVHAFAFFGRVPVSVLYDRASRTRCAACSLKPKCTTAVNR